jgi:hypothetical protein
MSAEQAIVPLLSQEGLPDRGRTSALGIAHQGEEGEGADSLALPICGLSLVKSTLKVNVTLQFRALLPTPPGSREKY